MKVESKFKIFDAVKWNPRISNKRTAHREDAKYVVHSISAEECILQGKPVTNVYYRLRSFEHSPLQPTGPETQTVTAEESELELLPGFTSTQSQGGTK